MADLTRKTWPRYIFILLAVALIGFFVFYHFRSTMTTSTTTTTTTSAATTTTTTTKSNEQTSAQQVTTNNATDTLTLASSGDSASTASSSSSSSSPAATHPTSQAPTEPAGSSTAIEFTRPAIHKDDNERPGESSTNEMSPPSEQHKQTTASNEAPIMTDTQPVATVSASVAPSRQNPSMNEPQPTQPDQQQQLQQQQQQQQPPPPPPQSPLMNIINPNNNQQMSPPAPPPELVSDVSQVEVDKWQEFKRQYNRQYASQEEELKRQSIFFANWRFIRSFNELGQASYRLDINQFADFTRDEINDLFIGPKLEWNSTINAQQMSPPMKILSSNTLDLDSSSSGSPRQVDWRNLTGAPVDQGACKESSVFAIVASLESALNAANSDKQLIKLSEQQLLDCLTYNAPPPPESWPPVCQGHLSMVNVFEFLQKQTIRFASLAEYSEFKRLQAAHIAPPNTCQLPPSLPEKPRLGSYVQVHRENIQEAIMNSGPLVVGLDASQPTFHFYKSGLYHEMNCSPDQYNLHALLVAYSSGATNTNEPSYTIRASFGQHWGEAGFMRLLKDEHRNKCLPQHLATYPNIALT